MQHEAQRAVHPLQFAHQVGVVLRRPVLVLKEPQHTMVWSTEKEDHTHCALGEKKKSKTFFFLIQSFTDFMVDILCFVSNICKVLDNGLVAFLHLRSLALQLLAHIL